MIFGCLLLVWLWQHTAVTRLPCLPVSGEEELLLRTTSPGHLWDAGNTPGMGWEAAEPQPGESTAGSSAAQQEAPNTT